MISFKQLTKDGVIKRADKSLVRYEDIHIENGFNIRDMTTPEFREHIEALKAHIQRGGKVPPLEVVPRAAGGVKVIDGHCRHIAYGELIAAGSPIEWIHIEQFNGNDAHQVARLLTSNEGRKLSPVEIAEGYRRLAALGLSPDEIGRLVGKTRQHVDQMMHLANAPVALQKAVQAGEVSATTAIVAARKHGDGAGDWLKEATATAKAAGKKKVTGATTKAWMPPAKTVGPVIDTAKALASLVKPEDFNALLSNEAVGDVAQTGYSIMVPGDLLLILLRQVESIEEMRAKANEKARGKSAKAAQMAIPESDGA